MACDRNGDLRTRNMRTDERERQSKADVPPGSPSGVGRSTMVGFVWLLAQTIATKGVNLGSQILLANLLLPADYDLIALAYTVTMLSGLLQQAGLREVLIHRRGDVRELANAACWMSFATGSAAGLLNCALAPAAVWFYARPEIAELLYVLAIAAPLTALCTVPIAILQLNLRFRFIATLEWATLAFGAVLTVALAWLGLGARSFVIPAPVVALIRLVVYWRAARPRVRLDPEISRWRYLAGGNLGVLLGHLATTLTYQGDYIALGRSQPRSVVGTYYLAFNFSTQTMRVFTTNLANVLLPTLSMLGNGGKRQIHAFLSATGLLTAVSIPLLLLQAMLAEPLVHLFLPVRWYGAIPILQILSIGMIGRLVAAPSQSLLLAQGRFRAYLWISGGYALVFLPVVLCLARVGAVPTAFGVAACMWVHGPLQIWIAIRGGGRGIGQVLALYRGPLMAALPTAAAAMWLSMRAAGGTDEALVRAGVTTAVVVALYPPLLRLVDAASFHELVRRLRSLASKREAGRQIGRDAS